MSGIFTITVQEERGFTAIPADIDNLAVVMGCSSSGSGLSSFYLSGASAQAGVGYGDAVDTLCQVIEQSGLPSGGVKFPAAFCKTGIGTAGSYGAIDISGVTGTVLPANDTSTAPYGTYEAGVRIVDDGNDGSGAELGTAGILYQYTLDRGRTWSNTRALGTAYSISIPNSNTGFLLNAPSAQVTAFIAAVVEARTDLLAHLADASVHDAADTSAEQVALAASAAPTTEAEAVTVMGLILAAYAAHRTNITVHNGQDPVNVVAHASPTTTQTGIGAYVEFRTDYNAHIGIALAASTTGLRAATATVASPVTLTSTDLLDAGEALLAVYPRRLSFTTAGATPSDAPATATITGTNAATGASDTEVVNLAQTATTVFSTKAWSAVSQIAYTAGDGTGATIAIGYGQGVHNSTDAVNVLSATAPTHGTLATDDEWYSRTFAPKPGSSDIDTAFATLAAASADFRILICDWDMTAALAARVTAGLTSLRNVGKRVTAIVRTRLPTFESSETEAAWLASVAADYASFEDSRICVRAGYGLVTDAMTGNQYKRSTLQQFAADVVRSPRAQWPCAPADPVTGLSGEPNVTLIDSTGATVGHDEGPRGAVTGLSDDTLGNRFSCEMRIPESTVRENVFNAAPWVMYAADERIRNVMVRRLANSMESVAVTAGLLQLGAKVFYTRTSPTTGILKASSRKALQGAIYQAVSGEFGTEIDNASDASVDTGLVQVSPSITISGGNLVTVSVTLAPAIGGFVLSLNITLAIKE